MLKQLIRVTMCDHPDVGDGRIMSCEEGLMSSGSLKLNAMGEHPLFCHKYRQKKQLLTDDGAVD